MKAGRPVIVLALGLTTMALLFLPSVAVPDSPEIDGPEYRLFIQATQGLGVTLLFLYVWASGTLFPERKRLAVASLLIVLVPFVVAATLSISDNYRAGLALRDAGHQRVEDSF